MGRYAETVFQEAVHRIAVREEPAAAGHLYPVNPDFRAHAPFILHGNTLKDQAIIFRRDFYGKVRTSQATDTAKLTEVIMDSVFKAADHGTDFPIGYIIPISGSRLKQEGFSGLRLHIQEDLTAVEAAAIVVAAMLKLEAEIAAERITVAKREPKL